MATGENQPPVPMAGTIPTTGIRSSSKTTSGKPIIIGIYGLPGSGKTSMLRLLRDALAEDHQNFNFFEGSEVIEEHLPQNTVIGVVATFESLDDEDKLLVRKSAIEHIVRVCRRDGKAGIVTGHLIF